MRHRRSKRGLIVGGIAAGILIAAAIVIGILWFQKREETEKEKTPEELLMEYTEYIRTGNYEAMYGMLNEQSRKNISLEDFTARNKNIYEGIGTSGLQVEVQSVRLTVPPARFIFSIRWILFGSSRLRIRRRKGKRLRENIG